MNAQHGADQSETVKALPAIIRGLRARGFEFVTLPELLHCPATLTAWPPADLQARASAHRGLGPGVASASQANRSASGP